MESSKREWLRKTGFAFMGLGLMPLESIAFPPVIRIAGADDTIRLRSNENPYGPSPLARQAMSEKLDSSNRYDWELTSRLIAAIAKKNNVPEDSVLLGAGSTEILDIAVRYTATRKGNFIIAGTTYDYWTYTAQALGLEKIAVPLTTDKKHDLSAMLKAIGPDTRMVYVCNPNNPSGTACDPAELASFIKEASKKAKVLLDEAYMDFTGQRSMAELVHENKNIIIARTFSKIYGLAGARIGYALAHPETIGEISGLQSSNSGVSVVSASGALASLRDESFVREVLSLNETARKYTVQQLEGLRLACIPSHANFVYFSLANYKKDFFAQLESHKILGTKIYEEEGKWTRITIGTIEEMRKFISAIS